MQEIDYTLLDRPNVSSIVFYPRPDWTPPPSGATDHAAPVDDGISIACRFYPCDRKAPSILYFHGNGEVASDYDGFAPAFHQHHLNLFVADYRGYGASDGSPAFSTMIADAPKVFRFFQALLEREGYAPRYYVMGRSLGAISALEVAVHHQDNLRGLILESGVGGVSGWARFLLPQEDPAPWQELRRRHLEKLRSIRIPLLTIHAERDELVPVQQALELRDVLSSERKELLIIPRAGHNDIFFVGMEQYMAALEAFTNPA